MGRRRCLAVTRAWDCLLHSAMDSPQLAGQGPAASSSSPVHKMYYGTLRSISMTTTSMNSRILSLARSSVSIASTFLATTTILHTIVRAPGLEDAEGGRLAPEEKTVFLMCSLYVYSKSLMHSTFVFAASRAIPLNIPAHTLCNALLLRRSAKSEKP